MSTETLSYRISSSRFIKSLTGAIIELPNGLENHDPRRDGARAAKRIIADVYGDSSSRHSEKKRRKQSSAQ